MILLCSCSRNGPSVQGHLIGTTYSSLSSIDFNKKTVETNLLYQVDPGILALEHIGLLKEDSIIFEEDYFSGKSSIVKLDLNDLSRKVLINAQAPLFISKTDEVFFIQRKDNQPWLYKKKLQDFSEIIPISRVADYCTFQNGVKSSLIHPAIDLGSNAIVFADNNFKLKKYNYITNTITSINISNCIPVGFIKSRDYIVCNFVKYPIDSSPGIETTLVDLKKKKTTQDPILKNKNFVNYIPELDAIYYTIPLVGPYYYLSFIYFLDTNKTKYLGIMDFQSLVWMKNSKTEEMRKENENKN